MSNTFIAYRISKSITILSDYKSNYCALFTPVKSFITSPAIIRPATEGTKATLPGIFLFSVHLCSAPGGHIQSVLQIMDISSIGRVGFSSE